MKNCGSIRWELSAYLDGELTPPQRTEVEAHLASCARCQGELNEMKALVTGVAALPKLQPAPRFLAEVRRKIASDEKPEVLAWRDYVFRPLWLKIPLEVAALIVIIGFVMRSEHPLPVRKATSLEFAKAENGGNTISSGTAATKTPGLAFDAGRKQLLDKSVASEVTAGGADNQPATDPRRMPMVRSDNELSTTPPAAPSPVVDLIPGMEFPRSKLSEIVTVRGRVFDEVRNQAQQLAARCSGRVVVVPQSKDATEQTFFVELPQEYVAAFKLELLKTPGPSGALAKVGIAGESGATGAIALSTGVLTGSAPTNNSADGLTTFGLRDDATIAAPATLLEIRVVAPAN